MGLAEWRRSKIREYPITEFFYFAMIENLDNLLRYGILPKNEVIKSGWDYVSFAEESVQDRRHVRDIELTNHTTVTIHDLVPVYLVQRTPTLSARRDCQDRIFFIVISADILTQENIEFAFSDGNAASKKTKFFNSLYKLKHIPWDVLKADYWNDFPDGKRKRNAEFLIFHRIEPKYFQRIVICNPNLQENCKKLVEQAGLSLDVVLDGSYFFT